MNQVQMLEAKVAALSARLAQVETRLAALGGGGVSVHDESVAARLVREYGGEWEAVKSGKRDARSCMARAYAADALVRHAKWSQRRTAQVLGVSRKCLQESLRKVAARVATFSQN